MKLFDIDPKHRKAVHRHVVPLGKRFSAKTLVGIPRIFAALLFLVVMANIGPVGLTIIASVAIGVSLLVGRLLSFDESAYRWSLPAVGLCGTVSSGPGSCSCRRREVEQPLPLPVS